MLNLIACLRPYWKCFQSLNDDDENLSLESYFKDWDDKNRQNIPFYRYDDPAPKDFPLTGFYPLYSDEENAVLDKKIDELIESTDLSVPPQKTCFGLPSEDKHCLISDKFTMLEPGSSECEGMDPNFQAVLEQISFKKVIYIKEVLK